MPSGHQKKHFGWRVGTWLERSSNYGYHGLWAPFVESVARFGDIFSWASSQSIIGYTHNKNSCRESSQVFGTFSELQAAVLGFGRMSYARLGYIKICQPTGTSM